jgi:hypothetical protein
MTLGTLGRSAEAVATFRKLEQSPIPPPMRAFITAWRAMFEDDHRESLARRRAVHSNSILILKVCSIWD